MVPVWITSDKTFQPTASEQGLAFGVQGDRTMASRRIGSPTIRNGTKRNDLRTGNIQ